MCKYVFLYIIHVYICCIHINLITYTYIYIQTIYIYIYIFVSTFCNVVKLLGLVFSVCWYDCVWDMCLYAWSAGE